MTAGLASLAQQAGTLLEAARADRSRHSIAEAGNVSDVTLFTLERGRDNPTLERLERVGRLYGVRFVLAAEPIEDQCQGVADVG